MKKIVLAFDGNNFSEGAFEFARRLNELDPILLTGIFLPQAELASLWSPLKAISDPMESVMERDDTSIAKENIDLFKMLCDKNNIAYHVHEDFYDFVLPELKRESLYADLIILGSEIFYENITTQDSNVYLQQALHEAACPVVVVPEQFDFPQSIIIAYDGKEESIFAIKQFAYLFPEWSGLPVTVAYAGLESIEDIPQRKMIEELIRSHFSNLSLTHLVFEPRKYFGSWMMEKKSAILVSGSFGRSDLSLIFKKSFVNEVIRDHRIPVFVSHR
jgi:hypothetical protein